MVKLSISGLRTPLFVPANRPERFVRAATSGADAVILDLEDSVDPSAKSCARQTLVCDFTNIPVIVRINGAGTPWHDEDLAAVGRLPFAAVLVPKAESSTLPEIVDRLRGREIIALVETARGIADARDIATQNAVTRLAFGSIDFAADIGCAFNSKALLCARTELVIASRLAGLPGPIDGVTPNISDPSIVLRDAQNAQELGMTGKLCIHPSQIKCVSQGFRPTTAQVEWAKRVIDAGEGAVALEGEMVDEPVRLRARAILADREIDSQ